MRWGFAPANISGCAHGHSLTVPHEVFSQPLEKVPRQGSCCCLQEKAQYRDGFDSLRKLKTEIEHRQQIAAQGRARVRADFARWLAVMRRQAGLPPPNEAESQAALPPSSASNPAGKMRSLTGQQSPLILAAGDDGHPTETSQAATTEGGPSALGRRGTGAQTAQRPVLMAAGAGEGAHPEAHANGRAPEPSSGPGHQCAQRHPAEQDQRQQRALTQPADEAINDAAFISIAQREANSCTRPATDASDDARSQLSAPDEDPFAGIDPEVLVAARPMLTGNMAADRDIIRFYEARTKLLRSQTLAPWRTL